jgi:hypothetical protein
MAIDRAQARRRVRRITGWAAGGAAVMTAAFAFGASRGSHVAAKTSAPTTSRSQNDGSGNALPQQSAPSQDVVPQAAQGFAPPASSSAPPSAMSGGS